MASKGGVVVVVSGQDNTGEVFAAVRKHLEDTQAVAKTTSESLGNIGKVLQSGLQMAGLYIGVQQIVGGFKEMIQSTMEAGVEIGKLREQTGITAENLSELRYVAGSTGVSFEALTKGFKNISTAVREAEQGDKKAVKAFADLGISVADLRAKGDDMLAVLRMVAEKFSEMPDGINKNALATELFKKSGQDLIPVLDSLNELLGDAKKHATIFTDEDIDKMKQMHEAVHDLSSEWAKFSLLMTSHIAPSVTGALQEMASGDVIKDALSDFLGAWNPLLYTLPDAPDYKPKPPGLPPPDAPPKTDDDDDSSSGLSVAKPLMPGYDSRVSNMSQIQGAAAAIASQSAANEDAAQDAAAQAAASLAAATLAMNQAQALAVQQVMATLKTASPSVLLGAQAAKPLDLSAIQGEAEKFAHGVFDPLFEFGEKWDKQWKQIRANMLKDLGQTAESQLFGALFGDPSGRGGKGWNGESHEGDITAGKRTGVAGPAGLVGNLLGLFTKKPGPVSNGIGAAGAGTVPGAAASLMQIGKSAGAGVGGVQVIVNNLGTPTTVDSTQTSGDSAEAMILQIVLKDQQTNGAITQGFSSMFNH